jgi:hypothetical protein
MSRERARALQRLEFRDPRTFLIQLREIEERVVKSDLSPKAKALRTNELKSWKELREGALFCYGIGQRIRQTVYLARSEAQDYDFVASWVVEVTQHLAPVQLKEVVPAELNTAASVQQCVDALSKYVDSEDLTVAIYLNRPVHFDPEQLVVPRLKIAALWVFGAISPDKKNWGLWGNFLEVPEGTAFDYPT